MRYYCISFPVDPTIPNTKWDPTPRLLTNKAYTNQLAQTCELLWVYPRDTAVFRIKITHEQIKNYLQMKIVYKCYETFTSAKDIYSCYLLSARILFYNSINAVDYFNIEHQIINFDGLYFSNVPILTCSKNGGCFCWCVEFIHKANRLVQSSVVGPVGNFSLLNY